MVASRIRAGAILVITTGMLGACATYPPAQQRIAYYVVPCDTPGAIVTGAPASSPSIAPAPVEAAPSGNAARASAGAAPPPPVCIVAAMRAPAYASSRYYPSGYYGRSYYARPVSSFGFGYYGGGSHGGGSHRGGAHGGGGHHGGRRH